MTNEEAIEKVRKDICNAFCNNYTEICKDKCIYGNGNCEYEIMVSALQENNKLKADNDRIYSDIKDKIIARRWNITSDCTPIERICMDWANRMNDWCVEIVEQSLKNNL